MVGIEQYGSAFIFEIQIFQYQAVEPFDVYIPDPYGHT